MNENQLEAELEQRQRKIEELTAQMNAHQEKVNSIARQILQIARENNLSVADMEQAFSEAMNFARLHARVDFDPEAFGAWASPKDIFSMGASFFSDGVKFPV